MSTKHSRKKKEIQHLTDKRDIQLNDIQNRNFTWTLYNPCYFL